MTAWLALAACNRYELFRVVGPDPETPTAADLLFVIDDSESMRDENVTLAEGFSRFVARLSATDAGFVDWRLAMVTTDAKGRAGELLGRRPVLAKGDDDAAERFVEALLCEAACFTNRAAVDDDPGFTCRSPGTFDGTVSRQALDCLCGADAWLDHCGGGTEQPLEAVLDAMCRTADALPDQGCDGVPADERSSVDGFLRPGAALVPVVVTDEGDSSPRVDVLEAWPGAYGTLYARFERRGAPIPMVWAAVAPTLDDDYELRCPGLAASWSVMRLRYLVEGSGGLYEDVFAEDCGPRDVSAALDPLADLIRSGGGAVQLPSEPEPETIGVRVGHRAIGPAEPDGKDVFGQVRWTDGWEYLPASRTVVLHGGARPEGDERVEVYYLPVGP